MLSVRFNYRHITLTDVSKGNVYFNISRETSAVGRRKIAILFLQILQRPMAHHQNRLPSILNKYIYIIRSEQQFP